MTATKGFRLAFAAALVVCWCGLTGAAIAQPAPSAAAVGTARELVE
ncbi:MAG: hypothetical protein QOG38_1849, partial [Hyphomicrobiales bacterium]|nr:hypothetical protein [Hyphomicrobiales bacterium]